MVLVAHIWIFQYVPVCMFCARNRSACSITKNQEEQLTDTHALVAAIAHLHQPEKTLERARDLQREILSYCCTLYCMHACLCDCSVGKHTHAHTYTHARARLRRRTTKKPSAVGNATTGVSKSIPLYKTTERLTVPPPPRTAMAGGSPPAHRDPLFICCCFRINQD